MSRIAKAHRRVAAVTIATVVLALAAMLSILGYLAWSSRPNLARAVLLGLPPALLIWLSISLVVEGLDAPGD